MATGTTPDRAVRFVGCLCFQVTAGRTLAKMWTPSRCNSKPLGRLGASVLGRQVRARPLPSASVMEAWNMAKAALAPCSPINSSESHIPKAISQGALLLAYGKHGHMDALADVSTWSPMSPRSIRPALQRFGRVRAERLNASERLRGRARLRAHSQYTKARATVGAWRVRLGAWTVGAHWVHSLTWLYAQPSWPNAQPGPDLAIRPPGVQRVSTAATRTTQANAPQRLNVASQPSRLQR